MHVGLITYQTGHLKTWQITRKMLTKGYDITLFAFPFKARPPKTDERYQDRPSQLIDIDLNAARFVHEFSGLPSVDYINMPGWDDQYAHRLNGMRFYAPQVYLHCTAKIIPASFIKGRTILNCHPGLLPKNRGVDALKWALLTGRPLGVTLHAIDAEIDRGTILKRMTVPVFPTDELADVCQRMYDFEIDLLGNFEHHLDGERVPVGDEYPCSHVKIPLEQDQRLAEIFRENRAALVAVANESG